MKVNSSKVRKKQKYKIYKSPKIEAYRINTQIWGGGYAY